MIRLRLLGSVELTRADGTEARSVLAQPKRLALLAYLAVGTPRGFHRRDRLLALFWPDADDAHARNALGQSLHFLRRALGAGVIPSRGDDEVGLDLERIDIDVLDFETRVRMGDTSGALERFRGEFMQGFHLSDLADVGRWLDEERARLGHLAWDAAMRHAEEATETADLTSAVAFARRAVAIRPANDASVVLLMTLLHRSGDRAGALEAFRRLEQELRDEYDAEPEPATVALSEQIRLSPGELRDSEPQSVPEPSTEAGLDDDSEPPGVAPAGEPASFPLPGRPARTSSRGRVGAAVVAVAAFVFGVALWESRGAPALVGEGERVILADFADATGEGIGNAVTEALRVDLIESSVIDLMEAPDLRRSLAFMRLEAGAPLTADRAREVALRNGVAAVIAGEVAPAGSGYLITATLREAASGRSLASFRVTAEGPDDVIAAIDRLSHDLRARSGESLADIDAGRPLEEVTTSSLEALRLYTEAERRAYTGTGRGSPPELLRRALALDSTFAMAWRLLGVSLGERDPIGRAEATANAFLFRERLPDSERYLVEGLYYSHIVVDHPKAIEAYERALMVNPGDPRALNNLAGLCRETDHLKRSEELLRRAIAGPDRAILHYVNLAGTLISLGRLDDAMAPLDEWDAHGPRHPSLGRRRAEVSFLQGDLEGAAQQARALSTDPDARASNRALAMELLARFAHWSGRLEEGRSQFLRAETESDLPRADWEIRRDAAYEEALVGDPDWARDHLREALAAVAATLPVAEAFRPQAAMLFASSGDPLGAEVLIGDWAAGKPGDQRGASENAAVEMAMLQVGVTRGDTAGVVGTMRRLLLEMGCSEACYPFFQATLHDRLGRHEEAAVWYERVRRPGYDGWGLNTGERLHAMMRLGPLYEALGDTTKAIEAYQRIVDQWAGGDARGLATVRQFLDRIAALEG